MLQELESRVAAIEDRFAIEALVANYAEAFDTMNMDLLATLWHPDSRLLLGQNGNAHGRDAILAQAADNMKRMPHMHHWMANALVTLHGDSAHGSVAANCLFYDIDQGPLQVSGQYKDIYERRTGRWAFVERRFTMHYATPLKNWAPVSGTERFRLPV